MGEGADSNKGSDNNIRYTFNRVLLKAKYALYSTFVFFLFANPETFHLFQGIFGKFFSFITPQGMPTIGGIFANTFLFFITMLGLMLLPQE